MPRRRIRGFFRRTTASRSTTRGELPEGWRYGAELGSTGNAAQVPVGPSYHRHDGWNTPEARIHLEAAVSYLGMITKRAYEQASERGALDDMVWLDAVHERLANAALVEVEEIRRRLYATGYNDLDVRRAHRIRHGLAGGPGHEVPRAS